MQATRIMTLKSPAKCSVHARAKRPISYQFYFAFDSSAVRSTDKAQVAAASARGRPTFNYGEAPW